MGVGSWIDIWDANELMKEINSGEKSKGEKITAIKDFMRANGPMLSPRAENFLLKELAVLDGGAL